MIVFNYQLIIEYDGTKFVGWQAQKSGISIMKIVKELDAGRFMLNEKVQVDKTGAAGK